MKNSLKFLLDELEDFGQNNDNNTTERSHRMLNITRSTGEFLSVMVKATRAQSILEIGTSNGYSTLWLAQAASEVGGVVTTVEASEYKIEFARHNFEKSGLADFITQIHQDAGQMLSQAGDAAFDLIFLDSERTEYEDWWPELKRALKLGGLLIADNALSHADEMASWVSLVEADADFSVSLVAVGKGEFLAVKGTQL